MNTRLLHHLAAIVLLSLAGFSARAGIIPVELVSYGYDDASPSGNVYADSRIVVDGVDVTTRGRGVNIVVVDQHSGGVTGSALFDTWGDSGAGLALESYLQSISAGDFVLGISMDSAEKYIGPALDDLLDAGAYSGPTSYRQSWAFVGRAGAGAATGLQAHKGRFLGPATLTTTIETVSVPAPGGVLLLLFGLAVLARCRIIGGASAEKQ